MLESVYQVNWLEQKTRYAFLLGVTYSILGIASALMIFPQDPGIVAIAFTSLIILPSLNKLLILEENKEAREKTYNVWNLFVHHWDIIKIYLFIFTGIMIVFTFFALVWPPAATSTIFSQQLTIIENVGRALQPNSTFAAVFFSNAKVLLVVLLASFIYGSGAIFIITWNASVWGTVLGVILKQSVAAGNPLPYILIALSALLPHMLAEAVGYFLGAIAGGVISTATLREKLLSSRFRIIIYDGLLFFSGALILIAIGAYIEVFIAGDVVSFLGV